MYIGSVRGTKSGQKWGFFLKGRGTKGKSMRKFRGELGGFWGLLWD